jgi:hypothetical protein
MALVPAAPTARPPTPACDQRDGPQDGDLVVTRETRSVVRYAVRQVPGDPQVTLASRDEAIQLARGFAVRCGATLWYCADGDARRLETYRSAPAATTSPG